MYRGVLSVLFIFLMIQDLLGNAWQQALATKKAQLDLHWNTSRPFIYRDADRNVVGLEYEIMTSFQAYLKDKYQIDLDLNWKESRSFYGVLETIRSSIEPNELGISAFSITEDRKQYVRFTDPYLPDITVLVSSQGTPIVRTFDEINRMMSNMEAITIKGTVYEDYLRDLKKQLNIDFQIRYIDSDKNILDYVSQTPNSFCFIDLPIYLMWIKKGSTLTRQNFFTLRGTGYGFIMPMNSDWNVPFSEFFKNPESQVRITEIISNYIGAELYEFIGNLYEGETLGTSLLTKEKEIQLALIKNANLKLEQEETFKRILISGIVITFFLMVVIAIMLYNNQKTTKILLYQKNQIEEQQKIIHRKNDQLMNRNNKLIALNEEKNNLINILAHDLRSPLSQITGLSGLLERTKVKMKKEEQSYLSMINEAANRMSKMIMKILDVDAIEGDQNMMMRETVNVNQILRDIAIRYRPAAAQKNIRLQLVTCLENEALQTDHLLLFLILENLISNAIKFSPPETKITLEAHCKDEEVVFKVSDQGPGFTDKDKSLLFNRFQQLSAKPTGDETSIGLGLSIVKKYVTDLGGEIQLESQPDKGSTFIVNFPVR